jgi:uncharacterized membrane protein
VTARTRALLAAFAGLGLAASAVATWVHYHLIVQPGYSSFCDVNATVSCTQAYMSRYGSIGGVPIAVGGIIFFTVVLLLLWASRAGSRAADSAPAYIFGLSTLGLAVVLYLAYASFFVLKEVCPICVATYVAVIGLFIVSGGVSSMPLSRVPSRMGRDLRLLLTSPVALVVTVLLVAGSAAAIAFFPSSASSAPAAVAPPALAQDQRSEFERWWEMQPRVDVPFPKGSAKVLIVKFSDYQCPACKSTHYAYAPILAKYSPTDVTFLLKQYPLNPECNAGVHSMVHTAACVAAAGGVMARGKGTLEALTDWFFTHQEEMSPVSARAAVKEVGKIADFDAEFPTAIAEVKADADAGNALNVGWTPTFFINGRRIPREGLPPQYFEAAINIELQHGKN